MSPRSSWFTVPLLSFSALCLSSSALYAQDGDAAPGVFSAIAELVRGGTPAPYRYITASERALYVQAFAAADRGDWNKARALAANGHEAVAAKLIEWRYLTSTNSGAPFAEIDGFLKNNPSWPMRETLLARAETVLPESDPAFVVAWFAGREPTSALGRMKLGKAELATGKTDAGQAHIRSAWIDGSFDAATEASILRQYGDLFDGATQKARLDSLLWRDEIKAAARQAARTDGATARIAAVRLALRGGRRDARALLAGLPAELSDDPALLYDRAMMARKASDMETARALLARIALAPFARDHASQTWVEVAASSRQALQDGDGRGAYKLVAGAGFQPKNSAEFADAQFLAGWIALRVLNDPKTALTHFQNVAANVSRPISVARGAYWQGRALEALGDLPGAWAAYHVGAQHPETFYGMLSLSRIDANPVLTVHETPSRTPSAAQFEKDEQIQAIRVLADLGSPGLLRRFALHYYEASGGDVGRTKRLLQFLTEAGFRPVAVRVAKAAGYDGAAFPSYAYPVIKVPAFRGTGDAPEAALVLSLIRQETEFDIAAVSSTGARGLMQVMPSGAKQYAKSAGLPFKLDELTRDPTYNMQLGMTMFSGYLGHWDGSLILGVAAYNAGPSNALRWVKANGDPRQSGVDPVDWIERIPFGETRNYVQRVVENVQVYRAELGQTNLKILDDLYGSQGKPPVIPAPKGKK